MLLPQVAYSGFRCATCVLEHALLQNQQKM